MGGQARKEKVNMPAKKASQYNRIRKALKESGVSMTQIKAIEPMIRNLATMADKLDEIAEQLPEAPLVVEYENGEHQRGVRENPIFKTYENLYSSYQNGMNKIIKMIDDGKRMPPQPKKEEKTVLDQILGKKRMPAA